jgi:hypothetical protein
VNDIKTLKKVRVILQRPPADLGALALIRRVAAMPK